MVNFQKCAVTRKESSVTIEQREDYLFLRNDVTGQNVLIPNELLPDLSTLLNYISGYF